MKRNISDLMEHIAPEEILLSGDIPLDPQRIREMTMENINRKKPIRRWGMRLLTAAVITVLLTMSVFAAETIMTYDNWFRDYFSGKEVVADISENQLSLLESSLTPINQSVTDGGYTVTLETAITDGYVNVSITNERRNAIVLLGDKADMPAFEAAIVKTVCTSV